MRASNGSFPPLDFAQHMFWVALIFGILGALPFLWLRRRFGGLRQFLDQRLEQTLKPGFLPGETVRVRSATSLPGGYFGMLAFMGGALAGVGACYLVFDSLCLFALTQPHAPWSPQARDALSTLFTHTSLFLLMGALALFLGYSPFFCEFFITDSHVRWWRGPFHPTAHACPLEDIVGIQQDNLKGSRLSNGRLLTLALKDGTKLRAHAATDEEARAFYAALGRDCPIPEAGTYPWLEKLISKLYKRTTPP